jgi:survival-of-motor-neuron-related-splicing factor 30
VGDTVLAKWVSGDNSFYTARITSITGSSHSPVYIVSFKSYSTTETLSAKDIKPISNGNDSKKRKADGSAPLSTVPVAPVNSTVISAAADINPDLAGQARREPSKVSDGPTRPAKVPRKVKNNKELEAGKSKWQDFTTKGKQGKAGKKESMFRTPTGVNGRGRFGLYPIILHRVDR